MTSGPLGGAGSRYQQMRSAFAAAMPLLVLTVMVVSGLGKSAEDSVVAGAPPAPAALRTGPATARTVVVILDSLREQTSRDSALMPHLVQFNESALRGPMRSCAANFTLPCLLTVFEGRASPFIAAAQNFSGKASGAPNWFEKLKGAGYRVNAVVDHTLIELYPGLFTQVENYDQVPNLAVELRDGWAFAKTLTWLREANADVIVTHIVGTDKVSHTNKPGSPEYAAVFKAADTFVGELASALDFSRDTLVVFGDHGHGAEGHHDRRAWYAVKGPGFAIDEQPLDQTSFLYLLSRIQGLTLPSTYEGSYLWAARPDDAAELAWRQNQARALGLADATREALDAERATYQATLSSRARQDVVDFLPWWLTLALLIAAAARTLAGAVLR